MFKGYFCWVLFCFFTVCSLLPYRVPLVGELGVSILLNFFAGALCNFGFVLTVGDPWPLSVKCLGWGRLKRAFRWDISNLSQARVVFPFSAANPYIEMVFQSLYSILAEQIRSKACLICLKNAHPHCRAKNMLWKSIISYSGSPHFKVTPVCVLNFKRKNGENENGVQKFFST